MNLLTRIFGVRPAPAATTVPTPDPSAQRIRDLVHILFEVRHRLEQRRHQDLFTIAAIDAVVTPNINTNTTTQPEPKDDGYSPN